MESLRRIYGIVAESVLATMGAATLAGNTTDAVSARAVLVRCLMDVGLTRRQIAILSGMSEHTVKKHAMLWPERCRSSRMFRHFRLEVRKAVHERVQVIIQESVHESGHDNRRSDA